MYFDILSAIENQSYKLLIYNSNHIVLKPTNIGSKITVFTPVKPEK